MTSCSCPFCQTKTLACQEVTEQEDIIDYGSPISSAKQITPNRLLDVSPHSDMDVSPNSTTHKNENFCISPIKVGDSFESLKIKMLMREQEGFHSLPKLEVVKSTDNLLVLRQTSTIEPTLRRRASTSLVSFNHQLSLPAGRRRQSDISQLPNLNSSWVADEPPPRRQMVLLSAHLDGEEEVPIKRSIALRIRDHLMPCFRPQAS